MKKIPDLKTEEEISTFWDEHDSTEYIDWEKASSARMVNLQKSAKTISNHEYSHISAQLKHELNEAKAQMERGGYIGIYEVFDQVISKYKE